MTKVVDSWMANAPWTIDQGERMDRETEELDELLRSKGIEIPETNQ